jgi:hypothetical protein
MSSAAGTDREKDAPTKHAAGALDIRTIIAGLIGLYGVVLIVVGLVDNGAAAQMKTGGVDANLWAGIAMVVVAVAFVVWVRLRPIVVDPRDIPDDDGPTAH